MVFFLGGGVIFRDGYGNMRERELEIVVGCREGRNQCCCFPWSFYLSFSFCFGVCWARVSRVWLGTTRTAGLAYFVLIPFFLKHLFGEGG